jgi:hypothetical protein
MSWMARRVRSLSSPCLRKRTRGIRGIGCVCMRASVHMRKSLVCLSVCLCLCLSCVCVCARTVWWTRYKERWPWTWSQKLLSRPQASRCAILNIKFFFETHKFENKFQIVCKEQWHWTRLRHTSLEVFVVLNMQIVFGYVFEKKLITRLNIFSRAPAMCQSPQAVTTWPWTLNPKA